MVWFESRSICRQEEFVRDLGQCQANGISQGTRRAEKKSPLHSSFSSHLPVCTFVLSMKSAQKALNMRYMLSSGPLMMEFDRPPANTMGSLLTHQFLSSLPAWEFLFCFQMCLMWDYLDDVQSLVELEALGAVPRWQYW